MHGVSKVISLIRSFISAKNVLKNIFSSFFSVSLILHIFFRLAFLSLFNLSFLFLFYNLLFFPQNLFLVREQSYFHIISDNLFPVIDFYFLHRWIAVIYFYNLKYFVREIGLVSFMENYLVRVYFYNVFDFNFCFWKISNL